MKNKYTLPAMTSLILVALLSKTTLAQRMEPDKAIIEAQSNQIQQMVVAGDIEGLIQMLSTGEFLSKVTAAEYLADIGDERALPELKRLNKDNGGWIIKEIHEYRSGAFAVAICKILTRNQTKKKQIEALFELLEGRGPAVPESIEQRIIVNGAPLDDAVQEKLRRKLFSINIDVGKRVAIELDKFNDPSIVRRLRQCENRGASPHAVWMEVRDMAVEDAIARCMEISRDEGGEQRYGAIHCLNNFGADSIEALNQLALEGHGEAITVLNNYKEDEEVFDILCWHLTNNTNSGVRSNAVFSVGYVKSDQLRLKSLQTLVGALYDPSKNIRRSAARTLSSRAYKQNKSTFDQIEDSLLIALKHPDADVREPILEALQRLGCERLNEHVPEPPPIRTDLEEQSRPPLTAEQRLKAKTEPLEKEATGAMEKGPPEKAVTLYTELLELRPGYEPYQKAIDIAKDYVKAAEQAKEQWYPDAPYIGLKGRYSYYLASTPNDLSMLKEKFELAQFLGSEHFDGWSNIFGKEPKGKDQHVKTLKLYEHIVKYYPANEYLVIRSKDGVGGLRLNLYKDIEAFIRTQIDIYAMPVENVVDSTDDRRNIPLVEQESKTKAQLDFERYYKDMARDRVIDLCTRKHPELLNDIITRCASTDPKIMEMAKEAKVKINQK